MKKRIELKFELPVTIKKRTKWYVACCPILDVCSQGETAKKAEANLVEALKLFFISCIERGTLDAVMKECGFKLIKQRDRKEILHHRGTKFINVPIPFQATGCLSECRA
ncbi:MAG: type II toxin-antitoxin system HicB family antitoxin [Nitrospirota bacterium]